MIPADRAAGPDNGTRDSDDSALARLVEEALAEEALASEPPVEDAETPEHERPAPPPAADEADLFVKGAAAFLAERADREAILERLRAIVAAEALPPAPPSKRPAEAE